MADEQSKETKDTKETGEAAVPAGPSMMKLALVVGVVAMMTAGIGTGAAVMLLGGSDNEVAATTEVEPEPQAEKPKEAIYINFDPAFVVNFQDADGRTKFLKAEVNAVTRDSDMAEALENNMPLIRNNLVLLFSRQIYEDLVSHEGKERLREEALTEVRKLMKQETGNDAVENVLFTSLVMQ